jgi:hypothetical protein
MPRYAVPCAVLTLVLLMLASGCQPANQEGTMAVAEVSLTGPEVLDRTIAYHDPQGKWDQFAGVVRLTTGMSNGRPSYEYLELDNSKDLYQSTRVRGETVVVRGIRGEECYREVNGNKNPPEEHIKQYGLSEDQIHRQRPYHSAHIGWPMCAKAAGVKADEAVEQTELRGNPVLAVDLSGDPATVSIPYWSRKVTLYVDPETYAMRGLRNETGQNGLVVMEGEIEVGGVKMPQVKTVYKQSDGTLRFTDLFTNVQEWEEYK